MRICAAEMQNGKKLLLELRGARLTSVQFVLNYLILGFDEKGALTTLVWPKVYLHIRVGAMPPVVS